MTVMSPPTLLDSARWNGMRVGLLGGSFNPPHQGHVHIAHVALHSLDLDAVWWLVTPQNPLKDVAGLLPFEERLHLSRKIVNDPRILVSDIEKDLGSRYTFDTVQKLHQHFPKTRFVWVAGLDNALTLHKWNEWRRLLNEICTVYITRQPAVSLIRQCPLRMQSSQKHVILQRGGRLPLRAGTTYWLLLQKMVNISSTEIREKRV